MGMLASQVQTKFVNGKKVFIAGTLTIIINDNYCEWGNGLMSRETAKIYYSDITSVSYSNGSFFASAFFQISTMGKTYYAKMVNEFSNMQIIVDAIEKKRKEVRTATSSMNSTNSISVADEIKKLKELADQGIISSFEFETKKKQLLGL